jgi:hypothetical protein
LELVLLAPVLLMVCAVIGGAALVVGARADVDDAAREAARAASLARSASDGQAAAGHAVSGRLDGEGWSCLDRVVDVDLADFTPGGSVAVEVTCRVPLSDAFGLLPGAVTVRSRSIERLEPHRGLR